MAAMCNCMGKCERCGACKCRCVCHLLYRPPGGYIPFPTMVNPAPSAWYRPAVVPFSEEVPAMRPEDV